MSFLIYIVYLSYLSSSVTNLEPLTSVLIILHSVSPFVPGLLHPGDKVPFLKPKIKCELVFGNFIWFIYSRYKSIFIDFYWNWTSSLRHFSPVSFGLCRVQSLKPLVHWSDHSGIYIVCPVDLYLFTERLVILLYFFFSFVLTKYPKIEFVNSPTSTLKDYPYWHSFCSKLTDLT